MLKYIFVLIKIKFDIIRVFEFSKSNRIISNVTTCDVILNNIIIDTALSEINSDNCTVFTFFVRFQWVLLFFIGRVTSWRVHEGRILLWQTRGIRPRTRSDVVSVKTLWRIFGAFDSGNVFSSLIPAIEKNVKNRRTRSEINRRTRVRYRVVLPCTRRARDLATHLTLDRVVRVET